MAPLFLLRMLVRGQQEILRSMQTAYASLAQLLREELRGFLLLEQSLPKPPGTFGSLLEPLRYSMGPISVAAPPVQETVGPLRSGLNGCALRAVIWDQPPSMAPRLASSPLL